MQTKRAPQTVAAARQTAHFRHEPAKEALAGAMTVHSRESGRHYRLDKLIGEGGFGQVYLATPSPQVSLPARVCIKISNNLTGWLREAYFAELLSREERALKVYDKFVEVEGSDMRYCLAMEYAEHGDLGAWLKKVGGQPERVVRREIASILGALDALHRGQALHRDLTPFNVFVCEGEQLKLGDFGIATHQRSRHGVTADAFNPFNAPTEIAWGRVRRWQQRDDIYQVGQLAAMLLHGDIDKPMRSKDVRLLPCSDHLKEVIYRCIASRDKRYEAAGELIAALRHRPKESAKGRLKSLKGCRLSFTGFLRRPRVEAADAARRAGAIVQSAPGQNTDVLVRGRPNALQVAGKDAGRKLMEIRRLQERGHPIRVIGEAQFWKLARVDTLPNTPKKKATRGTASAPKRAGR